MGRIRKGVEKLVNFGKVAIVNLPLIVGVYGCSKNYAPEAYLEISPKSGDAPLEVRMEVNGDDRNGIDDITEYRLGINSEVIKSKTPIALTRIFENEGKVNIYGEVVDSEGEINKTPVVGVEVYRGPFIEQSVSLDNDVNIKYSATLSKVDKAQLSVKRNNSQIFSQEITDVNESRTDYDKTFNYSSDGFTKGNYEFALKSDKLENKKSVTIPDYKPTADFTNIDIDMEQDGEISVTLGNISDKNPEDIALATYTNARSVDGKTSVELSGNTLGINGLPNQTGNYQVEVEYGSTEGGLEKSVLTGNITPHTWLYTVNPFVPTNSNGAAWSTLTTKAQRDTYVQEKLDEDWTNTMTYNRDPLWDCTEFSLQLMTNFHGNPNATGYSGSNLDSIYYYHGTYLDNGKYGLPVYFVTVDSPEGHNMNAILTGDDATKFENWCLIEPQRDRINVKPGELYVPESVVIRVRAIPIDKEGNQNPLVEILDFEIENGVSTLIWVNDDPNLHIVTKR
ncbi:MAG: hypothetical protein KA807_16165 [Prolixibacteraceae bacterium]|nr:hypothetical protein [Prolixibacteraceae bacterium]